MLGRRYRGGGINDLLLLVPLIIGPRRLTDEALEL